MADTAPRPDTQGMDIYSATVGTYALLDRTTLVKVTKTSVYVAGNRSVAREVGVSVRPVEGGRAKAVRMQRLTEVCGTSFGDAQDNGCICTREPHPGLDGHIGVVVTEADPSNGG